MADITAAAVSSLRARTGVSILLCKKALEEANGDEDKAIDVLRLQGEAQVVKRAAKDQKEGGIFLAQEGGKAALVVLHCETDFVSRNDDFRAFGQQLADYMFANGEDALKKHADEVLPSFIQKLGENISIGEVNMVESSTLGCYVHTNRKIAVIIGLEGGDEALAKDVAMHAAAMNPAHLTPENVTDEAIESEKIIWKEQLKNEGKPEQIWEKIMAGKEKKFREENSLTTQNFVKDPSITVNQHLGDATVTEYIRLAIS